MGSTQAEYLVSEYDLSSKAPVPFNPQAVEYIPRSVVYPIAFSRSRHSQSSAIDGLSTLNATEPSETSEALRAKLESDVKRAKMDRRMVERQVAIVNAENGSLRMEIGELTDDAETDRMYTEDLRRRFKEITRENEKLVAEAKSAKPIRDRQEAKIKELEEDVERLKTKVVKLELELQLKEPLFQVGVDVRTRYLEQAKEALWYVKTWDKRSGDYILKKYEVDSVTIEKGNRAAHGGNGIADGQWATKDVEPKSAGTNSTYSHWGKPLATEFDGKSFGYGPETSEPEQLNIFEELCHYRPTVYVTMPTKLLEIIDCEATIKTLKSLNEGLDRPLVEKQQALENVSIVVDKYPKLPKEEFDTDADVIRRVDRVKALTEMIVIYDRKKSGKASEGRGSGSAY